MKTASPIRPAPSLRTWLLALFWLALGPGTLSLVDLHQLFPNAYGQMVLNLARLDRAIPEETVHVVAIGTSKTYFALPFDAELAAQIDPSGKRMVFHRFAYSAATFTDLWPVFLALQRQPPDWLLIEGDLLYVDRRYSEADWRTRFRDNLLLVQQAVFRSVSPASEMNRGIDVWPEPASCLATQQPASLKKYQDIAARWRVAKPAQWQSYVDALRPLTARGTQVAVLDLPRAPRATRLVPASLDDDVAALRERTTQTFGYAAWSPGSLVDDEFCDSGHMNADGRAHYTAWLADRLRPLLESRP